MRHKLDTDQVAPAAYLVEDNCHLASKYRAQELRSELSWRWLAKLYEEFGFGVGPFNGFGMLIEIGEIGL